MSFGEAVGIGQLALGAGGLLFGGGGGPKPFANPLAQSIATTPGFRGDLFQLKPRPGAGRFDFQQTQPILEALDPAQRALFEELGGLQGQLEPGFGAITEARVRAVRKRANEAIGNLRQQLNRRRVQGSSFAEDTLARANNEFAQLEADTRAQGKLEEISAQIGLIQQRGQVLSERVTQELSLLGLSANTAAAFAQLGQRANEVEQQLAAQASAGAGQFFGGLFQTGLEGLTPPKPIIIENRTTTPSLDTLVAARGNPFGG